MAVDISSLLQQETPYLDHSDLAAMGRGQMK